MEENKKRQMLIDILTKLGVENPAKLATDRMVKKAQRRLAGGFPDGLADTQREFIRTELGVSGATLVVPSEGKTVTESVENTTPPAEEIPATEPPAVPKKGGTRKARQGVKDKAKKTKKGEVGQPRGNGAMEVIRSAFKARKTMERAELVEMLVKTGVRLGTATSYIALAKNGKEQAAFGFRLEETRTDDKKILRRV